MSAHDVAEALKRVESTLEKRPATGMQDDAPVTSRWDGGLRFVAIHANGSAVTSDMPTTLGGGGEAVSPGWYFRTGLASCTATVIAMTAAAEGIALTALELRVEPLGLARRVGHVGSRRRGHFGRPLRHAV